jgi:SAM-dependent methyltransferase
MARLRPPDPGGCSRGLLPGQGRSGWSTYLPISHVRVVLECASPRYGCGPRRGASPPDHVLPPGPLATSDPIGALELRRFRGFHMTDADLLIREAEALPIRGWDFSPLGPRWKRGDPPWDLRAMIRAHLRDDSTFVDLGTGGGELLSSIAPLPTRTVATEGYPPNLPVARARLGPLGVQVVPIRSPDRIPLPDRFATLVLSRHEEFDAREIFRVLRPGGTFLTQQVGG